MVKCILAYHWSFVLYDVIFLLATSCFVEEKNDETAHMNSSRENQMTFLTDRHIDKLKLYIEVKLKKKI